MDSVHRRRPSLHHPPPSPVETITPSSLVTSTSPTSYHHPSSVNFRPRRGSRYVFNRDHDPTATATAASTTDRPFDDSQQVPSGWIVDSESAEGRSFQLGESALALALAPVPVPALAPGPAPASAPAPSHQTDPFGPHRACPQSASGSCSSSSSWADFSDRTPSRHLGPSLYLTEPEAISAFSPVSPNSLEGQPPTALSISTSTSSRSCSPSGSSSLSTASASASASASAPASSSASASSSFSSSSSSSSSSRRQPSLSVRIPGSSEFLSTHHASTIVSRSASVRSKPQLNRNPSSAYYITPTMTSHSSPVQPPSLPPNTDNHPPPPNRDSIDSVRSDTDLLPTHLAASVSSASTSAPPSPPSNRSLPPYTLSSHKSINPYFTPYLDLQPSPSLGSSPASSASGLTPGLFPNTSVTTPSHSAYATPYATPGIFSDGASHNGYFPDGSISEKFSADPSSARSFRSGESGVKNSERLQPSLLHQTQPSGKSASRLQSVPQGQVVKEKISSFVGGTQVGWNRWWRKQTRKRGRASSTSYDTMGSASSTARVSGRKARRKISKLVSLGRWVWRCVPERTETYILTFFLFIGFAWSLTMFLMWYLNPDKRAISWHPLCLSPHPSYHSISHTSPSVLQTIPLPSIDSSVPSYLSSHAHHTNPIQHALLPSPLLSASSIESDALPPVGVFVGVFSVDKNYERRMLIRSTWASQRLMEGKGAEGLGGVRVRFIMGRPSWRLRDQVLMEMETYGDIVVLDITENMNSGKTQAYFSWAAENAMVPSPGTIGSTHGQEEIPPNYVVKADEDSFIMLGELEKRLRVLSGKKTYWGYLVKNQFMGGECYALSLDLVRYVSTSPAVRDLIHGAEDKLVARWMHLHPEKESILWVSDACFFYDHPRAGTVYSHGFLYPNTVQRIRADFLSLGQTGSDERRTVEGEYNPTPGFNWTTSSLAYSSVSTFGRPYRPPLPNLTPLERVEALVEGSEMSLLSPYSSSPHTSPLSPETVMKRRPSMNERYLGDWEAGRWGRGTVVVHYVKKNEWFFETALAFLGATGTDLGAGLGAARSAIGTTAGGGQPRPGASNAEAKVDAKPDGQEADEDTIEGDDLDLDLGPGFWGEPVDPTESEDGVGHEKRKISEKILKRTIRSERLD